MPKKDADPFSCFGLSKDGKPTGRWRAVAQTRDAAGNLNAKTIERKGEAECRKAMREWLRENGRLNPSPGMSVDAMMEAFIVRCEKKGRAKSTLRRYRVCRKALSSIGHMPIDKLMPAHVEAAADEIEGGASAVSARAFLRAAINKVARKADPKLPNVAELAEPPAYRPGVQTKLTEKGLDTILAREPDQVLRTLWLLYAGTGIRPVEGRGLMWPEIEEREDGMWIAKIESKTEMGKRPIPVPKSLAEAIRALPKTSVYLFPSKITGRGLSESGVRRFWMAAVERAGLPEDVNLYQLRHLFGTVQARKVKDHVLRRLMRHTSVHTSKQYYIDEFDDELRKAADA